MASTASTVKSWDVFLSFRGTDTRYNFISHLHDALCRAKVDVFIDRQLERGEDISLALHKVIESSRISIIVFSKDYVSSTYCLDEMVKIVECKESKGKVVLPIFYNVDPSALLRQTGSYGLAFTRHEMKCPEKIQGWRSSLSIVANLAGWHVNNDDEAEVVRRIVQTVLTKLNSGECMLLTTEMIGEAFERNMENILQWLKDEMVSRIGIYGMGGVGKTTLATHIHNRLQQEPDVYGIVYWVTVSQDFSIYTLQNAIAKAIQLDFDAEKDTKKRAAKLLTALRGKGKCILILDDLWDSFYEAEVGLHEKMSGYNLIITTRSVKVCEQLYCDKRIKVESLLMEEAWKLFREKLGSGMSLPPEVEGIAKSVARECDGLPLGIITLAGSMRGVVDAYEWRAVLKELKESQICDNDMEDKVFKVLRFSYNRLNNEALQHCLLYCALFPEDFRIHRERLIEYLIAEGIIEEMNSRHEQYDKGHFMLNKLEGVSLLDSSTECGLRFVKMHDLIRDMVIQIMRQSSNRAMVEAGKQLNEIPKLKYWTDDLIRVSLIGNNIWCIEPIELPRLPNLLTLLLSQNSSLTSIPDGFFHHMIMLKVLDLSHTNITKLPDSLTSLSNLTALLLNRCQSLAYIPSLAKMRGLGKLDISYTRIKEVPQGMESLSNLQYLNLCFSSLKNLPVGFLRKFLNLQYLRFDCGLQTSKEVMEEVASLKKLETLVCSFQDIGHYNFYAHLISKRDPPIDYILYVGGLRD